MREASSRPGLGLAKLGLMYSAFLLEAAQPVLA